MVEDYATHETNHTIREANFNDLLTEIKQIAEGDK